jgi:Protein of unknown function (DUF1153)
MSIAETFANADVVIDASVPLIELPAPDTKRWVVRRKAIVVAAVRNGSLSLQEACRRYRLSVEEFLAWQRAIDRHGVPGLRVTRLQVYRDPGEARAK